MGGVLRIKKERGERGNERGDIVEGGGRRGHSNLDYEMERTNRVQINNRLWRAKKKGDVDINFDAVEAWLWPPVSGCVSSEGCGLRSAFFLFTDTPPIINSHLSSLTPTMIAGLNIAKRKNDYHHHGHTAHTLLPLSPIATTSTHLSPASGRIPPSNA
jgi:hypothetical protein